MARKVGGSIGGTAFKITGIKRWKTAIDARGFDQAARQHMRRATTLNGLVAVKIMRKAIQVGSMKKLAPLTIAIKKSDKPMVDHGALFQAITSKVENDFEVFAGVLRTDAAFNIGAALHEGVTIKVTPAMRGMFFYLWKASEGAMDPAKLTGRAKELFERMDSGWLPLADATKMIVIPARPWVEKAFKNTQMVKQARDNWKAALDATFAERAKAGKGKD